MYLPHPEMTRWASIVSASCTLPQAILGRSHREVLIWPPSGKTTLSYLSRRSFLDGVVSEGSEVLMKGRYCLPMFVGPQPSHLFCSLNFPSSISSSSSLQPTYRAHLTISPLIAITSQSYNTFIGRLSFWKFCILRFSLFRIITLLSLLLLDSLFGDHLLRAVILPISPPKYLGTHSLLFEPPVPNLRFIMRAALVTGACALSWSAITYADILQIGSSSSTTEPAY